MFYLAETVSEEIPNPSSFEKFIASFDWNIIGQQLISGSIRIAFVLIVFYIFNRIAKWGLGLFFESYAKKHQESSNRFKTIYRITFNTFNSIFYFFLVYTILEILSFPVGTLLASAGIVGLAISLGAQGFVSDLVNGMTILMERQIDIGDDVTLQEISGTILNINLRTTQIKGFDGTVHFVPNREITIISNHSKNDMRALIEIPLFPDTDIKKIRRIIEETNEKNIHNFYEITDPPKEILFVAGNNNQLTLKVTMQTTNGDQFLIMNKFYELYISALTKAGIPLPYGSINLS